MFSNLFSAVSPLSQSVTSLPPVTATATTMGGIDEDDAVDMTNSANCDTDAQTKGYKISGTLMSTRNRMLKFVQKRFGLLGGEENEHGPLAGTAWGGGNNNGNSNNSNTENTSRSNMNDMDLSDLANMAFLGGKDVYNLVEEDRPVVLNLHGLDLSEFPGGQRRARGSSGNSGPFTGQSQSSLSLSQTKNDNMDVDVNLINGNIDGNMGLNGNRNGKVEGRDFEHNGWAAFDERVGVMAEAGSGGATAAGTAGVDITTIKMKTGAGGSGDVLNSKEIKVDENSTTINQPTLEAQTVLPVLSGAEVEAGLFSWRYPLLYDSREAGEDMVMAACRIMESANDNEAAGATASDNKNKTSASMVVQEALRFIEGEVSLQKGAGDKTNK